MSAQKETKECPHCSKLFINLEQHITKSHVRNEIYYTIDKEYGLLIEKVIYNGIERECFGDSAEGYLFDLYHENKDKKRVWYDDYSLEICHNNKEIMGMTHLGYKCKRTPLYKHNWNIIRIVKMKKPRE
jgi:hypothetical protein